MYSLTIIGGGNVACGYDSPNDTDIITHIHGALRHPKIQLNAVVELNNQRSKYIKKKWGSSFKVFSNLKDCIKEYKSNIVVISTPTNLHLKNIEELLNLYNPNLIIVEKPIVANINEYEKLNILLKKAKVRIITHFTRRFDPSMTILTKLLKKEKKIHHFYGTFSKGLIHNGSHMIDLINRLMGNINKIEYLNKKIISKDIFGKFLIETKRSTGIISNIKSNKLGVFDLLIYTDKLKIEIINHQKHIVISHVKYNKKIKNELIYSKVKILKKTLNQWGLNLYDYMIKILGSKILYNKLKKEQKILNQLIFETQKKFFKKNSYKNYE